MNTSWIPDSWPLSVALLSVVWGGMGANAQPMAGDFRPQKVLDQLPPITEFPIKKVGDVDTELNPSELVIGVLIGKESRAYPVNMLTGPRREILNDTLGGKAIAATW